VQGGLVFVRARRLPVTVRNLKGLKKSWIYNSSYQMHTSKSSDLSIFVIQGEVHIFHSQRRLYKGDIYIPLVIFTFAFHKSPLHPTPLCTRVAHPLPKTFNFKLLFPKRIRSGLEEDGRREVQYEGVSQ
jgi:hypothetical protein